MSDIYITLFISITLIFVGSLFCIYPDSIGSSIGFMKDFHSDTPIPGWFVRVIGIISIAVGAGIIYRLAPVYKNLELFHF